MGFFNRLFKGKVFAEKQVSDFACEINLCQKKYMLKEFDIHCDTSGTGIFQMYAVFEDTLKGEIENWIQMSSRKEDGILKFYKNETPISEGRVFEIQFRNASCVSYKKTVHRGIATTTIVMTVTSFTIAGEEIEQRK